LKNDNLGAEFEVSDEIPAEMAEQVKEYRHKLIEKIAETDDVLIDKFLNGHEITDEELKSSSSKSGYRL